MDNYEAKNEVVDLESENPYSVNSPLEDRLKVIANLIIDRVIEDQQNGSLRLKSQNK